MTLTPSQYFFMVKTFMKNCVEQTSIFIGDKELIHVYQAKVLGIILQSNLKWDSHVSDLTIESCLCFVALRSMDSL